MTLPSVQGEGADPQDQYATSLALNPATANFVILCSEESENIVDFFDSIKQNIEMAALKIALWSVATR
jgi:hypothetical protein